MVSDVFAQGAPSFPRELGTILPMITVSNEYRRHERDRFLWSLLASAFLNLFAWAGVTWAAHLSFFQALRPQDLHEETLMVSSSSIIFQRRVIPQPQRVPNITHPLQPLPRRPVRTAPPVPKPQGQPTEIARMEPRATPEPRPARRREDSSLARQLAEQEQLFSQEVAQINSERAPISIATIPPQRPATYQRTYMDLSGNDPQERVEALLLPKEHWLTASMSCYYVHYYAQWSGGGSEDGNIPWPICYPRDHDAMLPLNRPHVLPVPSPPEGYVLPPGTALTPLLREIYTGEIRN
jgi:hypothetical protein